MEGRGTRARGECVRFRRYDSQPVKYSLRVKYSFPGGGGGEEGGKVDG